MKAEPIGIYVHFPFCVRKCSYCDFCSYPISSKDGRAEYITALCREIDGYFGRGISADTVFFGGGTPSLMESEELVEVLSHLRRSFDISPYAEVTVEANPGTVTERKLRGYLACGVNRLSLGLQSIHENELKILGRIHNLNDFIESYSLARALGYENINVDLMYGIPEQTLTSFENTLDKIISLSPEHVSLYGLIIEEGTPFFKLREKLSLPDEDTECDMYYLAHRRLADAGYFHYEISNYARKGLECRHNLKYWRAEEYLGFGAAAHSYLGSKRIENPDSLTKYLAGEEQAVTEIQGADAQFEYAMLALRLSEGICLRDYEEKFGISFLSGREKRIWKMSELGLMKLSTERLSLTERGFYVSNSILSELL